MKKEDIYRQGYNNGFEDAKNEHPRQPVKDFQGWIKQFVNPTQSETYCKAYKQGYEDGIKFARRRKEELQLIQEKHSLYQKLSAKEYENPDPSF